MLRDQPGYRNGDARRGGCDQYREDGKGQLVESHSLRTEGTGEDDAVQKPQKFFHDGKNGNIDGCLVYVGFTQNVTPKFVLFHYIRMKIGL